jgi:hypothetical protein
MAITKATASSIAPAAKGDLVAGSATNDAAVLTVGANDTVLTADSTTATGLKWAAAAGGGSNWSSVGSASLTGATSITISGISGADKLLVTVSGASSVNASARVFVRVNADDGNNYNHFGALWGAPSSYSPNTAAQLTGVSTNNFDELGLGKMSESATSTIGGYVLFTGGCNTSGIKTYTAVSAGTPASENGHNAVAIGGFYAGTSTISSITLHSTSGNFDAGTLTVYKSA